MKKVSLEDKTKVLDVYIKRPHCIEHPEVLRAIKSDVLKASNGKVKKGSEAPSPLYNTCMGLYRQFLKDQGLPLKLDGKKARDYKEALTNLISFMKSLAKSNGNSDSDENIKRLFEKLFSSWEQLEDFHKKQIQLPQIYRNIEEIITQIKNGNSTTTKVRDSYKAGVLRDLQSESDA
ncbi:hypothetical protein [Reichenbachiella sp.]|uniref:hypothetical protein n=1 Tax=Reichenbachiella sp. TaxID=2184521 RepID=UPI003B5D01C0